MSTATAPDRFTTLPDEQTLAATVTALEEHGFSTEVVDDLDAAREAVLARIPNGSSVMTNTSVTLAETGIADAINDGSGRWESARNKMFALDFATQAQQMKAIGGQPDYALGSVHAVTRDGTLVIASASGSQLASYAWGAANVSRGSQGRYCSFSRRSVRTISMIASTVSWRAQSRCSSTARETQLTGCPPAWITRSRPARWPRARCRRSRRRRGRPHTLRAARPAR